MTKDLDVLLNEIRTATHQALLDGAPYRDVTLAILMTAMENKSMQTDVALTKDQFEKLHSTLFETIESTFTANKH